MPRLPDAASAGSVSDTLPSAPVNPLTTVPAVQIPAPVAVESRAEPPAPEVASDAETLALPGLPGATGEENVPGITDEANKGRWVHLVSLRLQVSHIQWAVMRTLPFYVRGLLREVPIALIPEVCTIAALTDSDLDVLMDHHLMLWVRSKTWSECRPFTENKRMELGYQDALVTPLATIAVTEMELAEAFLEQQNEGPQSLPQEPDPTAEGQHPQFKRSLTARKGR